MEPGRMTTWLNHSIFRSYWPGCAPYSGARADRENVILRNGDFVIDPNTIKGYNKDKEVVFTVKEFAIVEYLMQNSGRIVSQEELLEHIWDEESNMFTQAIKVHVSNIRRKMNDIGAADLIKTVKGKGYMI
jgi:DNA-binding response OmpR family regulator